MVRAAWPPLSSKTKSFADLVPSHATFGDHATLEQEDWDAPVVLVEKTVVRVDIREIRLGAEIVEDSQGLIAQMAVAAGDQDQVHDRQSLTG